jgi:hypothetical protein
MEEEEEKKDLNPDALEAALGDDFIEIEEEEVIITTKRKNGEDEEDLLLEADYEVDIAFSQDDKRDWY